MEPGNDINIPIFGKDPEYVTVPTEYGESVWEIAYAKGLTTGLLMGLGVGILITIVIYTWVA